MVERVALVDGVIAVPDVGAGGITARRREHVSRIRRRIGFDRQSCVDSLGGIARLDTDPEFIRSRASVDFGSEIGSGRRNIQFLDGGVFVCFCGDNLRLGLLTILPINKCWLDLE